MVLTEQEKAVIAIIEKARNEIAKLGYKPDMQASVSFNHNKHGQKYKRFYAGLEVSDHLFDESVPV